GPRNRHTSSGASSRSERRAGSAANQTADRAAKHAADDPFPRGAFAFARPSKLDIVGGDLIGLASEANRLHPQVDAIPSLQIRGLIDADYFQCRPRPARDDDVPVHLDWIFNDAGEQATRLDVVCVDWLSCANVQSRTGRQDVALRCRGRLRTDQWH